MTNDAPDTVSRWAQRRWAARAIRAVVLVAPLLISIGVAWTVGSLLPRPSSFGAGVLRWVLVATLSTVVLVVVDKVARRLLPLAALFGLTLAFPDQAPSRFQIALRRGSTGQLRQRIAEAREGRLGDTPEEAAAHVLELAMALSLHDRLTRGHSERVRAYTEMIGEQMGLTARELDRMRWAGLLHDIGKLLVPGEILNKPGKLTSDEFAVIKRHPEFGRELVAPLIGWLGEAAAAVWQHHERWDGGGYPRGLSGTEISLAGRIVSVADAYDVMTSARSYKKPVSPAAARAELMRCSGTHFDPVVVRAFMNVSLGRLRFALGPLGWLAQVPMLPTAIGATATQTVTAAAATVAVGATAAGAGLGLSGQMPIGGSPVEAASIEVVGGAVAAEPEAYDLLGDLTAPSSTVVVAPPSGGSETPSAIAPADPAAGTPTPTSSPASTGSTSSTSSTSTTRAPAATSSTSTTRAPAATTTVAPVTTRATGTTSTSLPRASTSGTSTTSSTTSTTSTSTTSSTTSTTSTTTTSTTTSTTTTVPERPPWLPPAGVATSLHLRLPSGVDLDDEPVFALTTAAPTRTNAFFDPDGNGWAGLRIRRGDGGHPHGDRHAVFAFGGPTEARVAGPASARLHVAIDRVVPREITVHAVLSVCTAGGGCTAIADASRSVDVGLVSVPLDLDLGTIDAVVPAGGTLRLEVSMPSGEDDDMVFFADTTTTPSRLTVTFP